MGTLYSVDATTGNITTAGDVLAANLSLVSTRPVITLDGTGGAGGFLCAVTGLGTDGLHLSNVSTDTPFGGTGLWVGTGSLRLHSTQAYISLQDSGGGFIQTHGLIIPSANVTYDIGLSPGAVYRDMFSTIFSICQDGVSGYSVDLSVQAGMSGPYSLIFPSVQGSANQTLLNDGSGNLSWSSLPSASGVTGAIQFSGGSGVFSSDATNLFWDDTNDRLGIGINTPSTFLHIRNSSTTTSPLAYIEQASTGASFIQFTRNGSDFGVGLDNAGNFNFQNASQQARVWVVSGTNQARVDCNNFVINSTNSSGTATTNIGNFNSGSSNTYALGSTSNTWTGVAVQGLGVSWVGTSAPAAPGAGNARMYFNSTSTTLLANQNNVGYRPVAITNLVTVTTTYSVLSTDYTVLGDATSGAFSVTLPLASAQTGKIYVIKKIDSSVNAVTVARSGADTIDGATSVSLLTQYQFTVVQSDGTNWWII